MREFGVVLLMVAACGKDALSTNECRALAVLAGVNDELRDQVTAQWASADRAMVLWERWEARERNPVSPEEEGTGKFSTAGRRAREYSRAAFAVCQSSSMTQHAMSEISSLVASKEVRAAEQQLSGITCDPRAMPPEAKERQQRLAEWSERARAAKAAETAVVEACYRVRGGEFERVRPNSVMLLPTE